MYRPIESRISDYHRCCEHDQLRRLAELCTPCCKCASQKESAPNENRRIAEISIAELCGLIQASFAEVNSADDAVVFIARKIGIGRVSQTARTRIADALERARDLVDVE